ncbi:hypothetical protein N7G274_003946 [Stereocaulon virgatum]|uniref:Rhodopsin domain-containing protein n=1 Tax=Stereocaulon virgatum TaxID=373712 RepID=A0ABR4AG21_9LECA
MFCATFNAYAYWSQNDTIAIDDTYILKNPADNTRVFIKTLYIYEIGYYSPTAAVKIAILAFYRRIFPVTQLKSLLYLAIGIVLAYFVGSMLATTFQWSTSFYLSSEISYHEVM